MYICKRVKFWTCRWSLEVYRQIFIEYTPLPPLSLRQVKLMYQVNTLLALILQKMLKLLVSSIFFKACCFCDFHLFLFVTFVQIDFRVAVTITGFVIRGFNQQWVKNFYIDYSTDQRQWLHHREPDESYQVCTTDNLIKI